MFSRQRLVDIYEEIQQLDAIKDLNTPCSVYVDFVTVADGDCFGWVSELDDDYYEMELSSDRINDAKDLYETIAHELIHLHFLREGHTDWCDHTPEFHALESRAFNEIEKRMKW